MSFSIQFLVFTTTINLLIQLSFTKNVQHCVGHFWKLWQQYYITAVKDQIANIQSEEMVTNVYSEIV